MTLTTPAMLELIGKLTGGRPMIYEGFAFTDVVSGKPVLYFRDRFGRRWMAEHKWALFRVGRLSEQNLDGKDVG